MSEPEKPVVSAPSGERPRRRVCHIIHDLGPGGAEDLLVDLASVAPAAGVDVCVISLMPTAGAVHAERLTAMGVPVASLDLRTRWDPTAGRRAMGVVRAFAPDLLHTHLKHADIVGTSVSRRSGIPMVSTLHLIEDAVGPLGTFKRALGVRARARGAARTIAVSDALRRWYAQLPGVDADRVVTIRNGVRPPSPLSGQARDELRAALGVGAGSVLALTASIMREGKGHRTLLEAVRRIPADVPVQLVLAGDGPLQAQLQREAESLGVTERVRFLGYRNDVDDLLQAADLVVHPSAVDALPTTLIRALAASTPAVATTVGGIPEIVTADTGILVPSGDARALADAMALLAGDPQLRRRLGASARTRFDAEFDAGVWAGRLARCYEEVIAAHARHPSIG